MKFPARLVPDTSVVVKWFVREDGSDIAQRLRAAFRGRMVASDLLLPECVNAGWRNVRDGNMSPERAEAMVMVVPQLVSLVPPDAELARRALFIAGEMNHPAYDCVHIAFAEREGTVVATADGRLLNSARKGRWKQFVVSLTDAGREWTGDGRERG